MRSCRSGVNRRRLAVLAAPALLAIPSYLQAQVVFTAAPSGDWNVGGNWIGGNVPVASQNVQINANNEADILGGENVSAKSMTIGTGPASSNLDGTVTIAPNATLNLGSTSLVTSTIGSGANSAGSLVINGGQLLGTNEAFTVGNNSTGATGTILMNSGTINLTGTVSYVFALGVTSGAGTLIQNGGSILLGTASSTFGLGRIGTGYYDMENGTLSIGGIFQMASGVGGAAPSGVGTFIQNGGTITANQVTFAANGFATCTLNGGTLICTTGLNLSNNPGCTATVIQGNNQFVSAGSVDIGAGSNTGGAAFATYSMSSGTLSVGTTMLVGGTSTTLANGTFSQTGGFVSTKFLTIGLGTNSNGVVNVSGTGSIQMGVLVNPFSILQVGTSGNGTFNLCSLASGTSTLSVGTIQVGSVSSSATNQVDAQFLMGNTADSNSLPAVTAGTIDFGQTDNSPLTSRLFSMASGTLTAGLVDLTSYDGGRTAQNQATFQQLGGTANITSMTFAGGVYQVGGASTAPMVVNGAAITVNPQGMGVLPSGVTTTYAGGGTIATSGSVTFNGAVVNNGALLNIGAASNANGTVTFRGAQTNAVGAEIKVVSGQLNLQADGGLVGGTANLTLTVADHAVIGGGTFGTSGSVTENLGTLSILGGGVVRLNGTSAGAMPSILLHTGTLSIKNDALPTGTLDMAANDAIVDNGVFATIQAQVKSGYAGGTWAGPGIKSSAAAAKAAGVSGIGYAQVSELGTTTFDGVDLSAEPSAVVLKYTLLGDANLDGTVNALDFNALANNYGQAGKTWATGDFNYSADGTVDSNDFALLAANFNGNVVASGADVPDAAPIALGSVVPEPMSLSLIALSSIALMRRRRHL